MLPLQALSSERTESYKMLEANLAKANAEKADLANRVKYLEIKLEEVFVSPLCCSQSPDILTQSAQASHRRIVYMLIKEDGRVQDLHAS